MILIIIIDNLKKYSGGLNEIEKLFALLKNPKLAEEGRIHIKIDYEKEEEREGFDNAADLKESA